MRSMLKVMVSVLIITSLLVSCSEPTVVEEKPETDISQQETKEEPKEEPKAEEPLKEAEPASADKEAKEEKPVFPYIPEKYDPYEKYPVMFKVDGVSDKEKNNVAIKNFSLYLDPEYYNVEYSGEGDDIVFTANSIEYSPVGPIFISFGQSHVLSSRFVISDSQGSVDKVALVNSELDQSIAVSDKKVFTYFSEEMNGNYFAAVMHEQTKAWAFLYFVSDGEYLYSIQFALYNAEEYTDAQTQAMLDILNSIDIKLVEDYLYPTPGEEDAVTK